MWAYPTIVRPFGQSGVLVAPPAPPAFETALLDQFTVDGTLRYSSPDTVGLGAWSVIDNYGVSGDMLGKYGGILKAASTGTGVGQVQALAPLVKTRAVMSIGTRGATRRAVGLMWGVNPGRTLSTAVYGCWIAWLWRSDGIDGVRVYYSPDLYTPVNVVAYYAVPGGLTTDWYEVEADWSSGATVIRLNGSPIIIGLAAPETHLDRSGLVMSTIGGGTLPSVEYIQGWSS